jgi:hypothetical protein
LFNFCSKKLRPLAHNAMRLVPPSAAVWLAILGLASLLGCGPQEEKLHRVSGSVTFGGKPIPKGLIFFDPTTDGPQGFANIVEGKYDTAEQGGGVRGGTYNVRVNGFTGVEAPEAPFGQALFPEYNGTTELPAEDSTYNLDIPKAR